MKAVSAELLALLKTEQFYSAELYQIDLNGGGGTLLYCSGDRDIIANGIRYFATGTFGSNTGVGGPYFDTESNKLKLHQKIGLEVDTFTFDAIAGNGLVLGVPFLTACRNGVFDSAIITVERAYMPSYGDTSLGTITLFKGRVGSIDIGRSVATFNVNSFLELLNVDEPRNIYQAGCINTLGDATCQVALAAYAQTFTDVGGSSTSNINANITNDVSGYFDQGRVTFLTGALTGVTRTIKFVNFGSPGFILLVGVLPTAPNGGDIFSATPGCDKTPTGANGCPKFSNQARFRGFPKIPQPVTAF